MFVKRLVGLPFRDLLICFMNQVVPLLYDGKSKILGDLNE